MAPVLISGKLIEQLKIPALFDVHKIGTLQGMKEKINVYSLDEKNELNETVQITVST